MGRAHIVRPGLDPCSAHHRRIHLEKRITRRRGDLLLDGEEVDRAMNSLEHASSSYLRSAMHQPIRWHEWGEAAFAAAKAEDKPILLDIGAVWCHWCHVMDRESYDNE